MYLGTATHLGSAHCDGDSVRPPPQVPHEHAARLSSNHHQQRLKPRAVQTAHGLRELVLLRQHRALLVVAPGPEEDLVIVDHRSVADVKVIGPGGQAGDLRDHRLDFVVRFDQHLREESELQNGIGGHLRKSTGKGPSGEQGNTAGHPRGSGHRVSQVEHGLLAGVTVVGRSGSKQRRQDLRSRAHGNAERRLRGRCHVLADRVHRVVGPHVGRDVNVERRRDARRYRERAQFPRVGQGRGQRLWVGEPALLAVGAVAGDVVSAQDLLARVGGGVLVGGGAAGGYGQRDRRRRVRKQGFGFGTPSSNGGQGRTHWILSGR